MSRGAVDPPDAASTMDEARAMGNVDAIGGAGATSAADSPRAPIWLASASPRRRELLAEAGFDVRVAESDIDDASIPSRGATPAAWCMAMAWFKAARVCELLWRRGALAEAGAPRWLVAADTVCDLDGKAIGKPRDADECAAILRAFAGRAHRVVTGVCVLDAGGVHRERREVGGPEPLKSVKSAPTRAVERRVLLLDVATVELGRDEAGAASPGADAPRAFGTRQLSEDEIAEYVRSDRWRGKAGGYNFVERLSAGWPLRCHGDPTSVTGLPMRRLGPILRRLVAGEASSCR